MSDYSDRWRQHSHQEYGMGWNLNPDCILESWNSLLAYPEIFLVPFRFFEMISLL